ncbi:hypothetical protein J2T57_003908 [Natronocella acetinitrilica]|uniref:Capsule biosynthesis protein n=1 Tax=Natronocella acetinitrilica TaxID=414046 RepID=A0AAE3G6G2_9GAMM|nr:DUF6356 family protein [Natronocella acetinitrilica]MCP1676735.1 hypothetical protein [Natronocella acetinitrilica]
MKLLNLFTEHPASVGETYSEHMLMALSFAGTLFVATVACLIHAFFPFLFKTTASRRITELKERIERGPSCSKGSEGKSKA